MKNKKRLISLLKENMVNIEFIYSNIVFFEEFLREIISKTYPDNIETFMHYFDVMVSPIDRGEPIAKRIHLLSLILDFDVAQYRFPGKKMKGIIPYIPQLNGIFEGLIKFHSNGNSLIEVEYLYKKRRNQLWYIG